VRFSDDNHAVFSNGPGGLTGNIGFTDTGTYMFCFAPGTRIRTTKGDRAIEDLQIGDLLVASEGGTVPLKCWPRRRLTAFSPQRNDFNRCGLWRVRCHVAGQMPT